MQAAAATRCGQQQQHEWCGAGSSSVVQQECGAGSSTELSISSTSTALQKIKNLRGLQKTCNKNLALLAALLFSPCLLEPLYLPPPLPFASETARISVRRSLTVE